MLQSIVFAYDGSAKCRNALEEGIVVASHFNARCHLLVVAPPLSPYFLAAGPLQATLRGVSAFWDSSAGTSD